MKLPTKAELPRGLRLERGPWGVMVYYATGFQFFYFPEQHPDKGLRLIWQNKP